MIIGIIQYSNTNIIDFLTTRTFRSTSSPLNGNFLIINNH